MLTRLSRQLGWTSLLSLGLAANLHCEGSSPSDVGDGDGDWSVGAAGSPGASGSSGSGGSTPIEPPSYACSHQENLAPGECHDACPITLDAMVTCGSPWFYSVPEVTSTPGGLGVQFLATWLRETYQPIVGLLESGGDVAVTTLSPNAGGHQDRWSVAGFEPTTGALDLLRVDGNETMSISDPWTAGSPTWVQALDDAWSVRGVGRDAVGTIHVVARKGDEAETYAFGTAAEGFTEQAPGWSERAWSVGLSKDGTIISYRAPEADRAVLLAEQPGGSPQTLSDMGESIHRILPAPGVVTEASAPEFIVLASTETFARVAPPADSGLQTVDLPFRDRPLEACSTERCEGECAWEGDYTDATAIARTTDGRIWVASLAVHEDTTTAYRVVTEEDAYICAAEYTRDESVAEVVLHEVDLEAGTSAEVFSVPTSTLAPVPLHIATYDSARFQRIALTPVGTDLLLNAHVPNNAQNEQTFWTLRVDTTLIP